MLAGIYYGSQYGGSTTSILMRIPGEASSVMTCIDGYAMAKKGRAGAALCIAAVGVMDRWNIRRARAHCRRAPTRDHRAPIRTSGIHSPARPRTDLPRLYVVVLIDPDIADGLPWVAPWHDRHRQHDWPLPLQLRSRRTWRRDRHRARCSRTVWSRRNSLNSECRRRERHHQSSPARPCCRPARNGAEAVMPITRGTLLGIYHWHYPGLGPHHFKFPFLRGRTACLETSRGIWKRRCRGRRWTGNREQCCFYRRLCTAAGARHSD